MRHPHARTRTNTLLLPPHPACAQLLVREPYGVVQSFSKVLAPTLQELGYAALAEVLSELRALGCGRAAGPFPRGVWAGGGPEGAAGIFAGGVRPGGGRGEGGRAGPSRMGRGLGRW